MKCGIVLAVPHLRLSAGQHEQLYFPTAAERAALPGYVSPSCLPLSAPLDVQIPLRMPSNLPLQPSALSPALDTP